MKKKQEPSKVEDADEAKTETPEEAGDGEFKLTVRKLEMPVRPRGVLAE